MFPHLPKEGRNGALQVCATLKWAKSLTFTAAYGYHASLTGYQPSGEDGRPRDALGSDSEFDASKERRRVRQDPHSFRPEGEQLIILKASKQRLLGQNMHAA